jgi:hypothetical protein
MSEKTIEINVKKDSENEQLKQQLAEKTDESEDLKNKLGIIAEKKLEEKRKGVTEKINALIADPEKRAEMIENLNGQNPEGVKALETTMNILEEQLAKAKNQRFETPAGSPLVAQQMGQGNGEETDLRKIHFPNIESAIVRLREEKAKGNPQAEQLLDLLWKKGIDSWRQAGHPSQSYSPDSNTEKSNSIPEINFDSPKVTNVSGFPQIKKSPYGYSRTHNAAGQKKE